ncbi:MAG TPA: energy transducer TonB, partial [Candidatus Binatia bacterium]|nr:energy transducer TonB [Candidatus Binatia bacterium]
QVINTIKAQWTNVVPRPGLVAAVRFEIAADGQVGNVRLAQSSGNTAYDASAVRAVQHASRLPPPPARYASEFREFQIEFHSEETGGRGAG